MGMETFVSDGVLTPYCISIFDGIEATEILIKYKIFNSNHKTIIHEPDAPKPLSNKFTIINGYKLPNNTNILSWGKILSHDGNLLKIEYKEKSSIIFDYS